MKHFVVVVIPHCGYKFAIYLYKGWGKEFLDKTLAFFPLRVKSVRAILRGPDIGEEEITRAAKQKQNPKSRTREDTKLWVKMLDIF